MMFITPNQTVHRSRGFRPLDDDPSSLEKLQKSMQGGEAVACSGVRRLGTTATRQMQADKSINQLRCNLPGTETVARQPQGEVLRDSEILSDAAVQIPRLFQIADEVLQDYAQMAGGHTAPDVGAEQSDSFHVKPGTKRFSRLRHASSNPLKRKEKP
jgi:hypothetical protein